MTANVENKPKSLSDYSSEEFQILLAEAKVIAENKMQQFYEDIVSVQPIHKNEKLVEAFKHIMTPNNTINEQFSVTFKGFKTKEEAKQFATWYSIQGEQQIDYWLDCRREEGIVDCVSMTASNINDDTNNIIVDLTVS